MKIDVRKYIKLFLILFLFVFGCSFDLQTKKIAKENFKTQEVKLVTGVFHLTYVENHSVAFGFLKSINKDIRLPLILSLTSLIGLGGMWVIWKLRKFRVFLLISLIILLSGAFGNIIDRFQNGYVTDFLHVHYQGVFDFPVFNVADILINIGLIMLLFQIKYFDRALKLSFPGKKNAQGEKT